MKTIGTRLGHDMQATRMADKWDREWDRMGMGNGTGGTGWGMGLGLGCEMQDGTGGMGCRNWDRDIRHKMGTRNRGHGIGGDAGWGMGLG